MRFDWRYPLIIGAPLAAKRFTEAHEWVSFDPDLPKQPATIGITDYAQNSLGDIVFVELPIRETEVERGGPCMGSPERQ